MTHRPPRSRPVVLLHGWTMRGSIFDDLVSRLPDELECHAPDLPGHGALASVAPSLKTAAETLADLLQSHDLEDVLLVGWSMGAAVSWQYIEQFGSDRIAGLMTADMSPKLACDSNWPFGLIGQSQADVDASTARMERDWRGMSEAIATTMFGRPGGAPGYDRQTALAQILANDPDKMVTMWKALVDMDHRDLIPRLPCPLLATCGALSRVYPSATAEWLASSAPDGQMHMFHASGHSPHLEEPEAFADALVEFAQRL